MDASEGTITSTSEYLKYGIVYAENNIGIDELVWHINNRAALTQKQLRSLTLPTIGSQILAGMKDVPRDFANQQALKVYVWGTEPFSDYDTAEWWFVDRDLRWLWLQVDNATGRAIHSGPVSIRMFVERAVKLGNFTYGDIHFLRQVVHAFKTFCEEGADKARERELLLRDAAKNHADFITQIRLIRPLSSQP